MREYESNQQQITIQEWRSMAHYVVTNTSSLTLVTAISWHPETHIKTLLRVNKWVVSHDGVVVEG